jgi:hypothetical protein
MSIAASQRPTAVASALAMLPGLLSKAEVLEDVKQDEAWNAGATMML